MPHPNFVPPLCFRRSLAGAFLGALLCCAFAFAQPHSQIPDLTKDVYPFLGVDWGGNTFVGAALPFGMVKAGPDMEDFDSRASKFGYMSGGRILGFSHLHLSGAAGKYGNILVAPVTGPLDPSDISSPRTEEVNHPGYYAATLTRYATRAEITASRRVALHRYTFPASEQSHLTLNLDH